MVFLVAVNKVAVGKGYFGILVYPRQIDFKLLDFEFESIDSLRAVRPLIVGGGFNVNNVIRYIVAVEFNVFNRVVCYITHNRYIETLDFVIASRSI